MALYECKESMHVEKWLYMQTIKNRLDQLDEQMQAITDHMTKISGCTPSEEEEVGCTRLSVHSQW